MNRTSRTETTTRIVGRMSDRSDWHEVEETVVIVTVFDPTLGAICATFTAEPSDEDLIAALPPEWQMALTTP